MYVDSLFKRDSVTIYFATGVCHKSASPKPLNISLGSFQIFRKFAEIFASQGVPPVSTTLAVNLLPVPLVYRWKNLSLTPAVNLPPANFEKFETVLMEDSGAWGKLIHE